MPCVTLSGTDSHVFERGYQRILSLDDWAIVWQKHKGQETEIGYDYYYDPLGLPLVDFSQFRVIAVFEGHRVNGAGLMAESIIEDEESITLRFNTKPYSTLVKGIPRNEDGTIDLTRLRTESRKKVNVYGFFVIPRSGKSVILEERLDSRETEARLVNGQLKSEILEERMNPTDWKQCFKFDDIQEKR